MITFNKSYLINLTMYSGNVVAPASFKKLAAAEAEVKLYWTLKFPTAGMKLLPSRSRDVLRALVATMACSKMEQVNRWPCIVAC